jgi:hypothetical protein
LVVLVVVTVGCRSSIGVKTVPHDQFDYAEAIRDAGKEQMLLNLVGLRYAEAPMFLKVTSVISNYTFEGGVAAAAQATTNSPWSVHRFRFPESTVTGRRSPTCRCLVPSSRGAS